MRMRVAGCLLLCLSIWPRAVVADDDQPSAFAIASFSADVTIPLGHRCMGILPTKATTIEDPLSAHGFVLLGDEQPVVVVALDWCEVRNGAYDQWRDAVAKAAGTTRERVLLSSLHQHDAPVTDNGAQEYLDEVGLPQELFDRDFQNECIERVCEAMRESLLNPAPATHFGIGQSEVHKVASNRRVERDDGSVEFDRGSSSAGNPRLSDAPDGTIDPNLKTISFWNGDQPVLALHAYATHPMSYYGRGGVSADFVGMARRRRQRDDPHVAQMYVSGCSGDVTAGKYNDGSPAMRPLLAERLYDAMKRAWAATERHPITQLTFRTTQFDLPFHDGDAFTREHLLGVLKNDDADTRDRILAAMGLSSRNRLDDDQPIDMPCLDFGDAQIVLLPGEAFVGYQLMAQQLRTDSFVLCIGYGECWPGYIPTKSAFDDGFGESWRWTAPGCEERMRTALRAVLMSK